MKDVLLLVAGAIVCLLFTEAWKWLGLDKRCDRYVRRLTVKEIPAKRLQETFLLGQRDTHTCIIDGNGVSTFRPDNIVCRYEDASLAIPEELKQDVEIVATAEEQKRLQSQPHAWNGRMVHIRAFTPSRVENTEKNQLLFALQTAQYYHFVAANAAIHREFQHVGFASPTRKRLIGEFSNWRTEVPPMIVNGFPLNLFILTDDDNKLVFSQRSGAVAIAPNEISCAANENMHPDHDRIGDGDRLDVPTLIRRTLGEESGWKDHDSVAETSLLAFAIHTGSVAYGLFGYSRLPISYSELQLVFAMSARDRHETRTLIPVTFDIPTVCGFIHHQNLYNGIGAAAVLVMIHGGGYRLTDIDREFLRLQHQSNQLPT